MWKERIDPISLDPIRTLRYPPFELKADPASRASVLAEAWQDVSVIVQTANAELLMSATRR